LTGTLKIENGVVTNDDLSAKSPAIRVAGAGQANLVTELVDYKIEASVAKTTKGQGGEELTEVGGYTVPVHCQGTFAEPGCTPDFGGLAKAAAQKKLEERKQEIVEKAEEKLQEKLGDQIGDKLKDVLKF
jgi:AsmA protein